MVAVSAFVAFLGPYGGFGLLVGVPGLAFFSIGTLYGLGRALRPRPAVVLGRTGFTDHASAVGIGFVPWRDVKSIAVRSLMGQRSVVVTLRNPEVHLARQARWKRVLLRLNRRVWSGHVFIPATVLPMPPRELAREMEGRRRDALG